MATSRNARSVVVQGIIHMDDTEQQVVRYEAIRENAARVADQMFSSFIKEWAEWIEDVAAASVKPDPTGGSMSR
eukprot:4721184-Prorocentrum_lima.AAC.1